MGGRQDEVRFLSEYAMLTTFDSGGGSLLIELLSELAGMRCE